MKKKSLLIAILIGVMGIIILIIAFTFLIKDNNKRTHTTNKVELSSVTKLLKKDYLTTNAVFGNPTTADNDVTIDSIKYDMVTDISSISDLQKLIKSTYTGDILSTYLLELDKYNKYVEVEKKLYVNINSKCNIDKFDDKITIVSETDDEITVKTNNREIAINKDGNIYKLKDSAYNCE